MSGNKNTKKSRFKTATNIAKGAGAAISAAAVLMKTADSINEWRKGNNHPQWYTKYGDSNLVALSLGQPERLGRNDAGQIITTDAQVIVEMVIPQDRPKSAAILSQAAAAILTQIRTTANVNANYTIEDVVKAILNLREITAGVALLTRTFEGSRFIDPYDGESAVKLAALSFPVAARTDSSVTPGEKKLLANISNIEARINAVMDSVRMLIPMNMALLERTYWLFSNFFVDSPSTKYSLIVPTVRNLKEWTYDEGGNFTFTATTFTNADELFDWINKMVAKFVADPAQSKLAGDLMKAYGSMAFPLIPRYSREERAHLVYDEDILNQIQSAKVLQYTNTSYYLGTEVKFNVRNGTLSQYLTLPVDGQELWHNRAHVFGKNRINTYRDAVEPGRALSLTRLAWTASQSVDPKAVEINSVGTEVVVNVGFATGVTSTADGRAVAMLYPYPPALKKEWTDEGQTLPALVRLGAANVATHWSLVDWLPALHLGPDFSLPYPSEQLAIKAFKESKQDNTLFDAQNWALIDEADLAAYHTLATKSLLWISSVISKPNTFSYL